MKDELNVAEDYRNFFEVARELVEIELKDLPSNMDKKTLSEERKDRMSKHLISMIEMYSMNMSK